MADDLHTVSVAAFLRSFTPLPNSRGRPIAQNRLLCHLKLLDGRFSTWDEAIEAVYGDLENGGPLAARHSLASVICYLRQRGYRIEVRHSYGMRLDA